MINYTDAQFAAALARAKEQGVKLQVAKGADKASGKYLATSSNGVLLYQVDAAQGACSCKAGERGLFCKHLAAGIAAMRANRAPRLIERAPTGPDLAKKARTVARA